MASGVEEHGVPGRRFSIRVESGVPQAMSVEMEDQTYQWWDRQSPVGLQT